MERRHFLMTALISLFPNVVNIKKSETIWSPARKDGYALISAKHLRDNRWDVFGCALKYVEEHSGLLVTFEDLNMMSLDLEKLGMRHTEPNYKLNLSEIAKDGKYLRIRRNDHRFMFDYVGVGELV